MSYLPLPAEFSDELPRFCTECGYALVKRVTRMLPRDPQTGMGKLWEVLHCPFHENSRDGTKHHFWYHREWYHDAWMIRLVEEPAPAPPKKRYWFWEIPDDLGWSFDQPMRRRR